MSQKQWRKCTDESEPVVDRIESIQERFPLFPGVSIIFGRAESSGRRPELSVRRAVLREFE